MTLIKAGLFALERATSVAAQGKITTQLCSAEFRVLKTVSLCDIHYISIDDIVIMRKHHKNFINLFGTLRGKECGRIDWEI
jgi:hypothetical protein